MITIIGLAVGIDYSLFTVSRYRAEHAHRRVWTLTQHSSAWSTEVGLVTPDR
jgi:uncharacterized membrane protein YdfJ with MMPL/SSD domain